MNHFILLCLLLLPSPTPSPEPTKPVEQAHGYKLQGIFYAITDETDVRLDGEPVKFENVDTSKADVVTLEVSNLKRIIKMLYFQTKEKP